MLTGPRARVWGATIAGVWLAVVIGLDLVSPSRLVFVPFFPFAALIACAVLPARRTAVYAALAVFAALGAGWWDGTWATNAGQQWVRVVNASLVGAAAVVIAVVRVRREREHERIVAIADVAQKAVLPTLPPRVGLVLSGARYCSAADDALVGGDLYDWCHQGSTTRFLIGDVRGKGLDAVEQAARVIRCFRQFASSLETPAAVAREMSAYLGPYLDTEEFVTALIVDASHGERMEVVSCGHPPPLLVRPDGTASLPSLPANLPLGLGDLYQPATVPWAPGDKVLMYTDGLSEARDAAGEFLAAETLATRIRGRELDRALEGVIDAIRSHVGGDSLQDDMAVMLLENDSRRPVSRPLTRHLEVDAGARADRGARVSGRPLTEVHHRARPSSTLRHELTDVRVARARRGGH